MKTDAPCRVDPPADSAWPSLTEARERVLGMQTKLHRWSDRDPTTRFDDLFNLVVDPAFLRIAWERVVSNTGARAAGIDGLTARAVEARGDWREFLNEVRLRVKSGEFTPSPVRQRKIPKSPGKYRTLGIPTVADRVSPHRRRPPPSRAPQRPRTHQLTPRHLRTSVAKLGPDAVLGTGAAAVPQL